MWRRNTHGFDEGVPVDRRGQFEQCDVVVKVAQVEPLMQNHSLDAVPSPAALQLREVVGTSVYQPVTAHGVSARVALRFWNGRNMHFTTLCLVSVYAFCI